MKTTYKLIQLLADGKFHSGEELGQQLMMTRAGIWKALKQLNSLGLDFVSLKGKGYQLPGGLELLEKKLIKSYLSNATTQALEKIATCMCTESTNQYLLDQLKQGETSSFAFFTEYQTAGRGRHHRPWIASFGTNIQFSLLWHFPKDPMELAGLSLVVGVAVIRALKKYGLTDHIGLKWPNDIYWNQQKLGGVLIEMMAETHSSTHVVIGIGLNLKLDNKAAEQIDQDWIDLQQITGLQPNRNQLAGLLLNDLILSLLAFQEQGIAAFLSEWKNLDISYNKKITVIKGEQKIKGIARGVGKYGELLLENAAGEIEEFFIGDVSLR
jgi:BirA family biotin operon repressor/biotin-[acetyl-CoA-carboxylase] ligase